MTYSGLDFTVGSVGRGTAPEGGEEGGEGGPS